MKRLLGLVLLVFFPVLAIAADGSSLSLSPPASDYSVVFLGNIFGTVDGVLHGSGSEIMGTMFGVFNSGVLALGGIIIMYTLMVSTMNTAQEGQVLGQKWSSIWIPVRSTIGLALLIPKASGYCLMQIFVMWLVLQGVGLADKIWDAAINYLNRGGVIIQAEIKNPLGTDPAGAVQKGATVILQGQVCMLGLQKSLQEVRKKYLKQKQDGFGPCANDPSGLMKKFCENAVPELISTVNAVAKQDSYSNTQSPTPPAISVDMPDLDDSSPYSFLNGMCGTLQWNTFNAETVDKMSGALQGGGGLGTIKLSRAIGTQQMYTDLTTVAQIIVNNDPLLANINRGESEEPVSPVAQEAFGIPLTKDGEVCPESGQCFLWGSAGSGAVLFNGTEMLGAVKDYNGVLRPALNLQARSSGDDALKQSQAALQEAKLKGWILAGSYFFDLVQLNGSAAAKPGQLDKDSGLDKSTFSMDSIMKSFGDNNKCSSSSGTSLCALFKGDKSYVANLNALMGISSTGPSLIPPDKLKQPTVTSKQASSTVQGFITNSFAMTDPGQPGTAPLKFDNIMKIDIKTAQTLPQPDFDCGAIYILFFKFCLGKMMGEVSWFIFKAIYNIFMVIFGTFIKQLIMILISIPLQGFASIFQQGITILDTPGINPIVALAKMGTTYINFAGDLWLTMLTLMAIPFLWPMLVLVMMAMPIVLSWLSVMVGIGFVTAFYVPILPYLIFTFAAIAWLMAVIEAMVAGPIVALGVTHPEGHDAFGRSEQAIMILINVFLRPAMMIIGFITAIALSYVGIWLLNAGFDHAISFIQTGKGSGGGFGGSNIGGSLQGDSAQSVADNFRDMFSRKKAGPSASDISGGYTGWAGIFAFFFSVVAYTLAYLVIVQKSFGLITKLPDTILRWLGSQGESYGQESAQWGEEAKGQMKEAGQKSEKAMGHTTKKITSKAIGGASKAVKGATGGGGSVTGGIKSDGGSSSPSG